MKRMAWNIMIGRLRRPPGRAWLGTTPKGFDWIYDLFVERGLPGYALFQSSARENRYLPPDFLESLDIAYHGAFALQEIEGKFVQAEGAIAQRSWFEIVDAIPAGARRARFWDLAATEKKAVSDDPDWTAGVKVAYHDGIYYVEHVIHERVDVPDELVVQTAKADGRRVRIGIEQEPGAAGKMLGKYFGRQLGGYNFQMFPASGDKLTRAMPWIAQARVGNVKLLKGGWNEKWLDEITTFPVGDHDDQVDATSGACEMLTTAGLGIYI